MKSGLDVSPRALHAFITVVEQGQFAKAADRLYMTSPALSQQMRRLEAQVGHRLLDRAAHPLRLTEAGEAFLPHARSVVESLSNAERDLAAVERRHAAVVKLGFINGVAGPATNRLLSGMHQNVELLQLDWTDQVAAVESGRVDASLIRPPLALPHELESITVAREPRVVTLPSGHGLAHRDHVSIADLADEVHIRTDADMPEEWILWWAVDPRPDGTPVKYGPVIHTMEEQLQMVANGMAISITAASIADYYSGPGISFVPVADIELCRVDLVTRRGDEHPGVVALRELVRGFDAAE